MTNHIHALVTAPSAESLAGMMQCVGNVYVRFFNRRHHRTGTLWEGRYWSGLIADERYWLTCLRYIEMNPVAARLVEKPEAYPWSSYRANACGVADALLTPHRLYTRLGPDAATRAATWAILCRQPIPEAEIAEIRSATRRGEAIGGFVESEDVDPLGA